MNRRTFLSGFFKAGATVAILPGALTYTRKWRKSNQIYVPEFDSFFVQEQEAIKILNQIELQIAWLFPADAGQTLRAVI